MKKFAVPIWRQVCAILLKQVGRIILSNFKLDFELRYCIGLLQSDYVWLPREVT